MTDTYRSAPGLAASGSKYCRGCAAAIHATARACPRCGAAQSAGGEKNRAVAVVLALILGGIGFHKFYLGRILWGIIYLLFSWTFIPAIVAFIEGLIYAFMSEDAFHAKYG